MARNDIRPIIKLKSTAGTGYTYVTRKNKRNNPDRITLKKYDPVVRKHVELRGASPGAQGHHQKPEHS